MKKNNVGLYWFRHDLRLHDMPSLRALASQCDSLILCYVLDPSWFIPNRYGAMHLGHHRQQFLYESLQSLHVALKRHQQQLVLLVGDPVDHIRELANKYQVTHIGCATHPGKFETDELQQLKASVSAKYICDSAYTLFSGADLPFEHSDIPKQFTTFRKKIEQAVQPSEPIGAINHLPPSPPMTQQTTLDSLPLNRGTISDFHGGESAGIKQWQHFTTETHAIKDYKTTRNQLVGWQYSTKLSPWLANGSLSVRWCAKQLVEYEQQYGANDSTYWVYFELLWREFFYWQMPLSPNNWFAYSGVNNNAYDHQHTAEKLHQWQRGLTPNQHINACMNQLNSTGYLSNRARQWVASYLINDLQCDWRYGAAYFEQQLLDYDVANNWGNWLYLAGVGHDPRGKRYFSIEKQVSMYDPQHVFLSYWGTRT